MTTNACHACHPALKLDADGTDATIVGATSATQCSGVTVVPESKMKQLQDLAQTPSRDLTLKGLGRRLLASRSLKSFEPDEPCSLLGEELAQLGLVANASTFLAEVRPTVLLRRIWHGQHPEPRH